MKSLNLLKILLLIIPCNALAHPGHEGFLDKVGIDRYGPYLIVSAVVVALAALAIFLGYARRR